MRANDYAYVVFLFDDLTEMIDVWTGRIAYHQACCKMNKFNLVFLHLFNAVLYVSAWTSSTGSVSY